MSDSQVLIMGDVHANWDVVPRLLNRRLRPNIRTILQVGDLGYWPRATQWHEALGEFLDERDVTLYFADGNHEDHDMLDAQPTGKPLDAAGRIYHVKRGDVLNFGGHRVLFFGGAVSVDKEWRTPGHSWFDREVCDFNEFKKAWDATNIEYVVAHDLPWVAKPQYPEYSMWPKYLTDAGRSNREQLTGLAERLQPRTWFAGHHHRRLTTDHLDGTVYEVMSCDGDAFERIAAVFDLDLGEWVQDAEDSPAQKGLSDLARLSIDLSAPKEARKDSDDE